MNTPCPPDDTRLEALLRGLPLRAPNDDALKERLEHNLRVAYGRRRMRRISVRISGVACVAAAVICALPHFFTQAEPGDFETHCDLVQARYTGHTREGAAYDATYERRIILPEKRGRRIVVCVTEERRLLVPDETI